MDADHPDLEEAYAESCDRMALQEEAEQLRAINRELIESLEDMLAIATSDNWRDALTGRQLIARNAAGVLFKANSLTQPTKTPPRPV